MLVTNVNKGTEKDQDPEKKVCLYLLSGRCKKVVR